MAQKSVAETAAGGDRRETLLAVRDKLANELDHAEPAVVAQIAHRLAAILVEIDSLFAAGKVSELDDLDQKRKDRVAAAKVQRPARAEGGNRRR